MRSFRTMISSMVALGAALTTAAAFGQAQVLPAKKGAQPIPVERIEQLPGRSSSGFKLKEVDPNSDQPIFSVDTLSHDFGTVWVGPALDHTFKVTNKGTKTLEFTKVRPSCGCTIAGNYPKKLEAGQTGEFPFSIASTKVHGRFAKTINISCNDPVNSDIKLTLSGHCKRYVDIMPAAANFGRVYGGDPQERILKVTNNTPDPLELDLDVPASSPFDFNLTEVEKGKQYEIKVSMRDTSTKPGSARTTAVLKTNVESQSEIKIAATATIPERIDIVPSKISLASTAAQRGATRGITRIVRITNYGKDPLNITDVSADNPAIKTNLTEKKTGYNFDIRIELPTGYEAPAAGNKIVVKTTDPEYKEIAIPIESRNARRNTRTRPAEQLVGKPAPEFSAETTIGKPLSNETLKEAITVMDFFAVNCGFCGKQIPRVEKIRQEYEGKGVRFVAAAETMRNKKYTDEQVLDKLKSLDFRGEVLMDTDNHIGPLFKATSFPTMVILGKSGKVEAVNIGNIGDLETRMRKQLDALLSGKPVPTIADAAPKKRTRPAETMVGQAAPEFSLTTMEGKGVSSSEFGNHPATVLNFVAPNCGFCKRQLPNVEKIRETYEGKGVRFVVMSETMRKPFEPDAARDVYRSAGSRAEIAVDDDNKIGKLFKATSYPTMMVIGKDGKVAHVNIGAKPDIDKLLADQLDELIKKAGS